MDVLGVLLVCFFCFQAEDGIRDLVRSRGLGDVYKRQMYAAAGKPDKALRLFNRAIEQEPQRSEHFFAKGPVSYTHLTLPTIYSV